MRPKILIDINSMIGKKTGVGVFVERLLINLANTNNYELTAYYFNFLGKKKVKTTLPNISNVTYKEVKFIPVKVLSALHRIKLQLPVEFLVGFKKYSFLLFPDFVSLPTVKNTPQAVIIHDLAFLDCPQYVQNANQKYLQTFVKRSVKRARFICTISEFTKSRIDYHYKPGKHKPVVVLPIPFYPNLISDSKISAQIKQLANSNYLLFVGTLEPRKNVGNLVLAFASISKSLKHKYRLVLAGKDGWDDNKLKSILRVSEKKAKIETTGYITDAEKDLLYKNAKVVCLLSHYEGFGMPILEASHYNKPVVLSSIAVFRDIAGENAYYCNQNDVQDIIKALESVLKAKKPKLITNNYSWEENISTLQVFINKYKL